MTKHSTDKLAHEQTPMQRQNSGALLSTQRLMSGTCLDTGVSSFGKKSIMSQLIGRIFPAFLRVPLAIGTGLLAFATVPAFADDECGMAAGANAVVNCTDTTKNPYAGGINYINPDGITLDIGGGIVVDRAAGTNNNGIYVRSSSANPLIVNLAAGAQVTTDGELAVGVKVLGQGNSDITIRSAANISVFIPSPINPINWGVSTDGILGWLDNVASTGNINITQLANSTITVDGEEGLGIYGLNYGMGSVSIEASGTVDVSGEFGFGINAWNNNTLATGNTTVVLKGPGNVVTSSYNSAALYSLNYGLGNATVISEGSVVTHVDDSYGVNATVNNQTSHATSTVTLSATSSIVTSGLGSLGAWALNRGFGETHLETAGSVITSGDNSNGVMATTQYTAANVSALSANLIGTGTIVTSGVNSTGLVAEHFGTGPVSAGMSGNTSITTTGALSNGISASGGGNVSVTQAAGTRINVSGAESFGVDVTAGMDASVALSGTVSSAGEYGVGAAAFSRSGPAVVTVGANTVVTGGWQATAAGNGASTELPSAGVLIGSGTQSTLNNLGIITAGSDRAIANVDRWDGPQAALTVNNNGTTIGFVELAADSANIFNN
ncbi:hypothetical protein G3A39_39060, partial [Paraburkholderia aspalathi]|nr:hypothetical protein [Paraburkholderia aspalathi]